VAEWPNLYLQVLQDKSSITTTVAMYVLLPA
jgi:hypothetical protein